jgi:hypothetical protein
MSAFKQASRYLNPLRLSAYFLVLYCVGHTRGALLSIPSFGPAGDAVLASCLRPPSRRCSGSSA